MLMDPTPIISSGLGAVGSLATGFLNNLYSRSNAEESFQNQKVLMHLQNQYSRQNWALENAYNTPKAQMERLRAAGLNPNLIYGNGASGLQSGSVSSPTAPSAPMAQTVPFSNPAADASSVALAMNQAKKAGSETVKQDIENKYFEDQMKATLEQTKAFTSLTKEQKAKVELECQNVAAEWNKMQEEINSLRKNNQLTDKVIAKYDRRMNAEIDALLAESDLTKMQKEILRDNKDNLIKLCKGQADLASTSANLADKYGDAQAIVGLISAVVSAGADVASAFIPSKKITQIINKITK